ncbi:MAG TPA: penicillin-binding transpeptidase domain-containing protein, partial [Solirubrobacteraceae bacterium]|nr:penicillin-binding transpeptidase domain-containing protein [Solirubrobacteraceae bacterium]
MDERTPPMTPQLALRVAIIGTCALVMFAVIFFRLWFLQVLSGSQYVAQAAGNTVRHIPVAAPRGQILSSNGTVMVDSQPVPAIEIATPDLPQPVTAANLDHQPATDYVLVYDPLARLLKMSTKPSSCKYTVYTAKGPANHDVQLAPIPCLIAKGLANASYANVTIKTNVSPDVRDYIEERESQFPGVISEQVYLRTYPFGDMAAQVFGTVGPITQAEESQKNFKGAGATDIVGQSGLEYEYNQSLQGTDGFDSVKVNSENQFEGYGRAHQPRPGNNLQLSINLGVEKVGLAALKHSIAVNSPANSGAFVAMDPENGQIYGMGSLPSYNPSLFADGISQSTYDKDFRNNPLAPLLNRAIDSPLPDGSTFKVITATAALQSGIWNAGDVYDDTGEFCFPNSTDCLHNSGEAAYGSVDLERAIQVSDDVFFYHLGYLLNSSPIATWAHAAGGELQKWARLFGIGRPTGVDLPDEASGTLPSPGLMRELWTQERQCDKATGPYAGHPPHPAVLNSEGDAILSGGCGIANTSVWTSGDNVNTAVGQGYDQVTPLQLAVV